MSTNFWRCLVARAFSNGRKARRTPQARPRVEGLEDRTLPALTIIPNFDDSILNDRDSDKIIKTINQAIALYRDSFSDVVTAHFTFREVSTGLGHNAPVGIEITYAEYLKALSEHGFTPDDYSALIMLPNSPGNPIDGNTDQTMFLANPLARALGYTETTPVDDVIDLNVSKCKLDRSSPPDADKYDLLSVVCHEIDEGLGIGSGLDSKKQGVPNTFLPEDLFRFDHTNARSFDLSSTATSYFSIDNGVTPLAQFNQQSDGDYGDWLSTGPHTPQIQDAFGTKGTTPNFGVELRLLDVIGYSRYPTAAPDVTPAANQDVMPGGIPMIDLGGFTDPDTGPWNVDVNWGDGTFDTVYFVDHAGNLGAKPHATFHGGTFTVTVTVTDFTGKSASANFTVHNAPIVIQQPTSVSAASGETVTFEAASQNNASSGAPFVKWQYQVPGGDWIDYASPVDTTIDAPGLVRTSITFPMSAAQAGEHFRAVFTLDNAIVTTDEALLTYRPPAVSATGGRELTATEGSLSVSQAIATFTDPLGAGDLSQYHASIDWGDNEITDGVITFSGTPGSTSSVFTVTGAHTYKDEGSYTVNATISKRPGDQTLVTDGSMGFENDHLGTILDGTQLDFPVPGTDPNVYPAPKPDLAIANGILGNWLASPPVLNDNWGGLVPISPTWDVNAESAAIYMVYAGPNGMSNVIGNFGADNGVFVWVNGDYKFGAVQPGGAYADEYPNIPLGDLAPGLNYIEVLREDHGGGTRYIVKITGHDNSRGFADVTVASHATVADAPLSPTATPVSAVEGAAFSGEIATFTDANPNATLADFPLANVNINWGDQPIFGNIPNPVSLYRADGSAADSVGSSTGVLQGGTTFTTGHTGTVGDQAFRFAGENSSVVGSAPTGISGDAAVTLDMWVNLADTSNVGTGMFIGNAFAAAGAFSIYFNYHGAGIVSAEFAGANSVYSTGTPLVVGQWYNIAVVKSPGPIGSTTAIYVDGVLQPTVAVGANVNSPPNLANSAPYLGSYGTWTDPQSYLAGDVDDAAVFNRALTVDEVQGVIQREGIRPAGDHPTAITQPGGPGTPFHVFGTHTFADEGRYSVVVNVADVGGAQSTSTGTAHVADADLTATSVPIPSPIEGRPFTVEVATFTDANPAATLSDFPLDKLTILWGDGTYSKATAISQPSGPGTPFHVSGSHTYSEEGPYRVSVFIEDVGGSFTSTTGALNDDFIDNTLDGWTTSSDAGGAVSVAGGAVQFTGGPSPSHDPPALGSITRTVSIDGNFNLSADFTQHGVDGSQWRMGIVLNFGGNFIVLHDADSPKSWFVYSPSSTSGDVDGTAGIENQTETIMIARVGDQIAYGVTQNGVPHGIAHETLSGPWLGKLTGITLQAWSHLAPLNATVDNFRLVGAGAGEGDLITVTDAPLVGSSAAIAGGTEGDANSSVLGNALFGDTNVGDHAAEMSAAIHWGDNTSSPGAITYDGLWYSVAGTHTYDQMGSYPITIDVVDSGGSRTTITGTATVAGAPILAWATRGLTAVEGAAFSGEVGQFVDTRPNGTIADYPLANVNITWGDGQADHPTAITQPGGLGTPFHVFGTHTYAEEGSDRVSIAVRRGNVMSTDVPVGLEGLWQGEGTAFNSAEFGVGTLVNGVTFAPGKTGQAFSLNGTNGYVDLGSSQSFDVDDFTIASWVFIDPAQNVGERRVISRDDITSPGPLGRQLYCLKSSSNFGSNGAPTFAIYRNGNFAQVAGNAPLSAGWHYLAGTRTANSISLYIDGQLIGTSATTITGVIAPNAPLVLGQVSPGYNGEFFSGLIDDASLYGRALAGAEIQALFQEGGPSTLTVADAPLTAGALTPPAPIVGERFTATIFTFADANPHATASDFHVTVRIGDLTLDTADVLGSLAVLPFPTGGFAVALYDWYFTQPMTNATFSVTVVDHGEQLTAQTNTFNVEGPSTPTVNVAAANRVYDGTPYAAAASVVDRNGATITSYGNISFRYYAGGQLLPGAPSDVGDYTVVAAFTSGVLSYTDAVSNPVPFSITPAAADILVNGFSGVFDGHPHGATLVHATGVGGANLSASVNLGATYTAVPGGVAHWTFHNANYADQSGDVTIAIASPNRAPILGSLTSNAGNAATPAAGVPVSIAASFTDPDAGDVHHATIAWGDGVVTTIAENDSRINETAKTLAASHSFAAGGIFTISVTLFDHAGLSSSQSIAVYVAGASIQNGVLQIVGTGGVDTVTVSEPNATQLRVQASFMPTTLFNLANVTAISILLGDGNDAATVNANVFLPATIDGGAGDDVVKGGSGNDTLKGGPGNDTLNGNAGDDIVVDMDGDNSINTGAGADHVTTGTGNDLIVTGGDGDIIDAGDGDNDIRAGGGNNVITAGRGNDKITSSGGDDVIHAGDGANEIHAGRGKNLIDTGSGPDLIYTSGDDDTINAGDGDNEIHAGNGRNTITTGAGNDKIYAGSGDDVINAGGGDNLINANAGNNRVTTGSGNDQVTTAGGDDIINAGDGDNIVNAGAANNAVTTGSGNDQITTGGDNDVILAGNGNNTVSSGGGDDIIVAGSGQDTITAGTGNDIVHAGAGNDTVDGGGGNDTILGEDGDDVLTGGAGNDLIIGGNGADRIDGSGDDDILIGAATAYDANDQALAQILAEWTSTRTYDARIANLRGVGSGPRANGSTFLTTTQVQNDHATDTLTGSAGQDWFWIMVGQDQITDLAKKETTD